MAAIAAIRVLGSIVYVVIVVGLLLGIVAASQSRGLWSEFFSA